MFLLFPAEVEYKVDIDDSSALGTDIDSKYDEEEKAYRPISSVCDERINPDEWRSGTIEKYNAFSSISGNRIDSRLKKMSRDLYMDRSRGGRGRDRMLFCHSLCCMKFNIDEIMLMVVSLLRNDSDASEL